MPEPELDGLIAEAEMGEEARNFLKGNLGRCLIGIAEQEVRAAEQALGKVDPTDTKAIIALQHKVALYAGFQDWLTELVHNGEAAMSAYKQQRS